MELASSFDIESLQEVFRPHGKFQRVVALYAVGTYVANKYREGEVMHTEKFQLDIEHAILNDPVWRTAFAYERWSGRETAVTWRHGLTSRFWMNRKDSALNFMGEMGFSIHPNSNDCIPTRYIMHVCGPMGRLMNPQAKKHYRDTTKDYVVKSGDE